MFKKPVILATFEGNSHHSYVDNRQKIYNAVKKLQPCVMVQVIDVTGLGKTCVERHLSEMTKLPNDSDRKIYYVYGKVQYEYNVVVARIYATAVDRLPTKEPVVKKTLLMVKEEGH